MQENMSVSNRFAELRGCVVTLLERSSVVLEDVVPYLGDESSGSLPETFRERAIKVRDEEFVVVVVGEMNRGKSMLLNAMMHKQLLAMDVLECTATVNFLRYPKPNTSQSSHHAVVHFTDGRSPETVPVNRLKDYTSRLSALGDEEVANLVDHVDAFVESRFLNHNVLLVDTPGTNTTTENHIRITYDQIDRSNAAIFLLGAETQVTQSDEQFLKGVEGAVARLFFVVNKIDLMDESNVVRVLEKVERDIREAVKDPSKLRNRPVFGVSAAKAMLGRTGYVDTPIIEKDEWSKRDSPQFRKTLVEESGIVAFEEDLERYLFGGEKGRDLLHNPLSFIQSETNKVASKLNRQIEVLDGTSDLTDLELQIEKMERIVEERKHEREGMADELCRELSNELSKVEKDFDEECKLAVEELKAEVYVYDSLEALKNNWSDGAYLATLPGRKLAVLDRQAGKLINGAVERVLRKQTRAIRRQIQGELKGISLELPELSDMVLQLQEPKIDTITAKKIEKLNIQLEDYDRQLEELYAEPRQNESRYAEIQNERNRLLEERIEEIQRLGVRPEVRITKHEKVVREDPEGAFVKFKALLVGRERKQIVEEVKDDQERRDYDKRLERIEEQHAKKIAEIDRIAENVREKINHERLKRLRRERIEQVDKNRRRELEKAEHLHRKNVEKAEKSAADATQKQLVTSFLIAKKTLKSAVEISVGQTMAMATGFIDRVMEELDATLTTNKQELAQLKSLKEEKESERNVSKERIHKALDELKALGEEASSLANEHDAFIEESGEVTVTTNYGE